MQVRLQLQTADAGGSIVLDKTVFKLLRNGHLPQRPLHGILILIFIYFFVCLFICSIYLVQEWFQIDNVNFKKKG